MKHLLAFCLLLGACTSDDPIDVNGMYTLNFTRGPNGCNVGDWVVGSSFSNVPVTLNQASGSAEVDGSVTDAAGVIIFYLFGTNQFSGRVSGRDIEAVLTSTYDPLMQSQCSYKYQLHFTATLNGDLLTGELDITTATNHSPDCGGLESCHSTQTFNGLRPPLMTK